MRFDEIGHLDSDRGAMRNIASRLGDMKTALEGMGIDTIKLRSEIEKGRIPKKVAVIEPSKSDRWTKQDLQGCVFLVPLDILKKYSGK